MMLAMKTGVCCSTARQDVSSSDTLALIRSAGVRKVLDRIDVTTAALCFHLLSANLSTRGAQRSDEVHMPACTHGISTLVFMTAHHGKICPHNESYIEE